MNFQINKEDLKKTIEDFQKRSEDLGKIVYPILDKFDLEKKEILEVCQIGKFIHKLNNEIRIIDKPKPPSPDFIIEYQDKLIGLEHTQILTNDARRYFKIKTLLDYAEIMFQKKYPNINVHAIVSIKNDEINYKQNEKPELAKRIVDMVHLAKQGIKFELPDYITDIKTTRHSQVSFTYKEDKWQSEYLTKERLLKEVSKKEDKISKYKTSKKVLSEYWLVLLVGSISSVSYRLNESENYLIESKFDRVYLMADFKEKIIRVN